MVKVTNRSSFGAQLHGFKFQLYVTSDESLNLSKMKTRLWAGLTLHDSITMV